MKEWAKVSFWFWVQDGPRYAEEERGSSATFPCCNWHVQLPCKGPQTLTADMNHYFNRCHEVGKGIFLEVSRVYRIAPSSSSSFQLNEIIILKVVIVTIYWGSNMCQFIYTCCVFNSSHHIWCPVVLSPENQEELAKIIHQENEGVYIQTWVYLLSLSTLTQILLYLRQYRGHFYLFTVEVQCRSYSHACFKWKVVRGLIFFLLKILWHFPLR